MKINNPYIKTAVSKISPSIVRLTFSTGDELHVCSCKTNGTIFSSIPDDENGSFVSYILTSANLFEPSGIHHVKKGVSPFSKIDVCLPTDKLYEGEVMACDMEIKIAVIKIKSDYSLPTATLSPFTDTISVSPFGVSECHSSFCQFPYPTKVFPGDEVTVVCSAFGKSCDATICSGIYSVDYIGYGLDWKPFFRTTCENIINGAPVINCEGDVIGVAINTRKCAVFLPVNVFLKWWKQVVTYGQVGHSLSMHRISSGSGPMQNILETVVYLHGPPHAIHNYDLVILLLEIRRPWLGIQITNLYTTDVCHLEAIIHDCDVSDGVIIEEVIDDSPAYSANMRSKDVISQCNGRPVRSILEFTELLWDKSGEVIEAKGVKNGCHFVWKVEIESIRTELLPESLAEYHFTKDINTGILPEPLAENVAGKLARKASHDLSSVPRLEAIKAGILPESLAENVVTEAIKSESLAENVVASEKSSKRGKNESKDKKRTKKDEEVTGLKAKKRKVKVKDRANAAEKSTKTGKNKEVTGLKVKKREREVKIGGDGDSDASEKSTKRGKHKAKDKKKTKKDKED